MDKKIEEKIKNSGNNFHFQVCDYMKTKEWDVEIGNYYTDFESNKSREIDIVATKKQKISNEILYINLFVECKYCTDDIVFWFDEKNIDKTKKIIKEDFIFSEQFDDLNSGSLSNKDLLNYSDGDRKTNDRHHYVLKDYAVKLFTDGSNKLIYNSLNQVLNSLIFFTEYDGKNGYEINFPIILVNSFDKFYNQKGESLKDMSNFEIEVNYSYIPRNKIPKKKFFIIDIVNFEKIEDYLLLLEKDKSKTYESIRCASYKNDNNQDSYDYDME